MVRLVGAQLQRSHDQDSGLSRLFQKSYSFGGLEQELCQKDEGP